MPEKHIVAYPIFITLLAINIYILKLDYLQPSVVVNVDRAAYR